MKNVNKYLWRMLISRLLEARWYFIIQVIRTEMDHMDEGEKTMVKQIINLAVVNFNAYWGEKEKNYERILGYIECAHKRGADMIIFPELSLTGYDHEVEEEKEKMMHVRNAESRYGLKAAEIARLAKAYNMYIMVGLPERDKANDLRIYNSLLIAKPDATLDTYHKIHLALDEPYWATPGDKPVLLETPWGPIGIAICYDVYSFPELIRYYAAKGARLVVNATAYAKSRGYAKGRTTLESAVLMNGIYIATANLCGKDLYNEFWGGSSIIGPSHRMQEVHYYAGVPFNGERADEEAIYLETIDLSKAKRGIFQENPLLGRSDFRADLYEKLYREIK